MKRDMMCGMRRLLLVTFGVMIAFGLSACGGSSSQQGQPANVHEPSANSAQPYGGFEPRSDTELDRFVESAIVLGDERKKAAEDSGDLEGVSEKAKQAFDEANAAFKSSNSSKSATKLYEKALEESPLHRGANVNLALSYLADGDVEKALTQALACAYLFPDESGCILNVQIAGIACLFEAGDISNAVTQVLEHNDSPEARDTLKTIGTNDWEFNGAYSYNSLWSYVEQLMYSVSKGEMPPEIAYENLMGYCEEVESQLGNDDDIIHLRAFIDALAVQAGV